MHYPADVLLAALSPSKPMACTEAPSRLPRRARARRFRSSHVLQLIFDWVDVNSPQDLTPGSYSLVTQYPRRSFAPGAAGSLADAGLTSKQEAMFIQLS